MNPLVARLLGFGAVAAPPHVFALDARVLRYEENIGFAAGVCARNESIDLCSINSV